jgi:hypothetical protein
MTLELNDFYAAKPITWAQMSLTLLIAFSGPKTSCNVFARQCCGSGMFILDQSFSIQDPNFHHPGSRIRIKELSILTQKIVSKLLAICSGLFIPFWGP